MLIDVHLHWDPHILTKDLAAKCMVQMIETDDVKSEYPENYSLYWSWWSGTPLPWHRKFCNVVDQVELHNQEQSEAKTKLVEPPTVANQQDIAHTMWGLQTLCLLVYNPIEYSSSNYHKP